MAILNKYKNTLNDIKSPDRPDSPDRPRLIDKKSHIVLKSRSSSSTLLVEDRLNEDILIISLELVPKI